MKRLFAMIAAAALITSCNNEKTADETAAKPAESMIEKSSDNESYTPPDEETMMRNWAAYMTPGEAHNAMASWAGNWEGEVSMWMAPEAPPEKSIVSGVSKMVMGDRYLVSTYKGTMMGQPFEGQSILAYDNFKKKFIETWIDNMGTGVMVLEGGWNADGKSFTLKGKCVDATSGTDRLVDMRQEYKIVDANTQIMEMYGPGPDGKEMKGMEIVSKRKG